ncbi:hypothetical protein QBC35DRAFT_537390 [Podospora australis]|uniref:Uncharacterized protein n=1 Tax=Podospora australis TaxID=1536484 RepID=A0AAN7ALB9_9PEZI|nr:hypothetical protein QBC35DRAFT_537390 [Podospora australis]
MSPLESTEALPPPPPPPPPAATSIKKITRIILRRNGVRVGAGGSSSSGKQDATKAMVTTTTTSIPSPSRPSSPSAKTRNKAATGKKISKAVPRRTKKNGRLEKRWSSPDACPEGGYRGFIKWMWRQNRKKDTDSSGGGGSIGEGERSPFSVSSSGEASLRGGSAPPNTAGKDVKKGEKEDRENDVRNDPQRAGDARIAAMAIMRGCGSHRKRMIRREEEAEQSCSIRGGGGMDRRYREQKRTIQGMTATGPRLKLAQMDDGYVKVSLVGEEEEDKHEEKIIVDLEVGEHHLTDDGVASNDFEHVAAEDRPKGFSATKPNGSTEETSAATKRSSPSSSAAKKRDMNDSSSQKDGKGSRFDSWVPQLLFFSSRKKPRPDSSPTEPLPTSPTLPAISTKSWISSLNPWSSGNSSSNHNKMVADDRGTSASGEYETSLDGQASTAATSDSKTSSTKSAEPSNAVFTPGTAISEEQGTEEDQPQEPMTKKEAKEHEKLLKFYRSQLHEAGSWFEDMQGTDSRAKGKGKEVDRGVPPAPESSQVQDIFRLFTDRPASMSSSVRVSGRTRRRLMPIDDYVPPSIPLRSMRQSTPAAESRPLHGRTSFRLAEYDFNYRPPHVHSQFGAGGSHDAGVAISHPMADTQQLPGDQLLPIQRHPVGPPLYQELEFRYPLAQQRFQHYSSPQQPQLVQYQSQDHLPQQPRPAQQYAFRGAQDIFEHEASDVILQDDDRVRDRGRIFPLSNNSNRIRDRERTPPPANTFWLPKTVKNLPYAPWKKPAKTIQVEDHPWAGIPHQGPLYRPRRVPMDFARNRQSTTRRAAVDRAMNSFTHPMTASSSDNVPHQVEDLQGEELDTPTDGYWSPPRCLDGDPGPSSRKTFEPPPREGQENDPEPSSEKTSEPIREGQVREIDYLEFRWKPLGEIGYVLERIPDRDSEEHEKDTGSGTENM